MADESPKAKRRVRDPETFRERAQKASEAEGKTKKLTRTRSAVSRVFSPLARPFAVIGRRLGRFKPFRILGYILLPRFVRNSWKELKLVEWPNWMQSLRLTFAVIVFAIIFGVTVAAVDYGLDKIFRQLLV